VLSQKCNHILRYANLQKLTILKIKIYSRQWRWANETWPERHWQKHATYAPVSFHNDQNTFIILLWWLVHALLLASQSDCRHKGFGILSFHAAVSLWNTMMSVSEQFSLTGINICVPFTALMLLVWWPKRHPLVENVLQSFPNVLFWGIWPDLEYLWNRTG